MCFKGDDDDDDEEEDENAEQPKVVQMRRKINTSCRRV
jgi:hypothetical protein